MNFTNEEYKPVGFSFLQPSLFEIFKNIANLCTLHYRPFAIMGLICEDS